MTVELRRRTVRPERDRGPLPPDDCTSEGPSTWLTPTSSRTGRSRNFGRPGRHSQRRPGRVRSQPASRSKRRGRRRMASNSSDRRVENATFESCVDDCAVSALRESATTNRLSLLAIETRSKCGSISSQGLLPNTIMIIMIIVIIIIMFVYLIDDITARLNCYHTRRTAVDNRTGLTS